MLDPVLTLLKMRRYDEGTFLFWLRRTFLLWYNKSNFCPLFQPVCLRDRERLLGVGRKVEEILRK